MSVDFQKDQGDRSVACAVLTVSDTRTETTDKSGNYIKEALKEAGHEVLAYHIIKDDYNDILSSLTQLIENHCVEAIVVNGGTGMAKRDVTFEVVESLLEKEMPGFGELFRYLSYTEDIGTGAMLSRAVAGVTKGTVLFSLPGSTGAVRLALSRLILPELRHIVFEVTK